MSFKIDLKSGSSIHLHFDGLRFRFDGEDEFMKWAIPTRGNPRYVNGSELYKEACKTIYAWKAEHRYGDDQ